MLSNPNQNYNNIRGLTILISDIRNSTTREAEAKRVEKELDKIRKKFNSNKALSGYDKKKYVWKLLYIYILGYKIDFGYNYAADLITSIKFSEKITGYISMSILFKENNPEISIMINSIKNDLLNQNSLCQSMAITLTANLNNNELIANLSKEIFTFLSRFSEKSLYVAKKALVCLGRIIKVNKEMHDATVYSRYILKVLDLKNFETLLGAASLVATLIQTFGTSGYEEVAMKFFNEILYKMKECPEEYIYYHIKAPWLQIKILKIMELFNTSSFNNDTMTHLKEYVEYIGKKTQNISSSDAKYSRYYAEYCIFFETVTLIECLNLKLTSKTFDKYISILADFLQDNSRKFPNKDVNTKYLSLDGMAKLIKYTSADKVYEQLSSIIFTSLKDNDLSIRRRALDLCFLTCTNNSVKQICKELLIYFNEDEPQLKEDVALKIAILAEKYAVDYTWYIDVCMKMLEVAGDYVSEDIIYRIIQIVTGFENQGQNQQLQLYAAEKVIKLLENENVYDSLVKLAAHILGEFGGLIANDTNKSFKKQIELFQKHLPLCSNSTLYAVFNCFIKFVNQSSNLRNIVIPQFETYLESWDPELQQRAVEYIILCKIDGDDTNFPNINEVRSKLFETMPVFSTDLLNNSNLMRRLSKNQGSLVNLTKKEDYKSNDDNDRIETSQKEQPLFTSIVDPDKILLSESSGNHPFENHIIYSRSPDGFAPFINKNFESATLINKDLLSNNSDLFKSMITNSNPTGGLIFTDQNLKIDAKPKQLEKGVMGILLTFSCNDRIEDLELNSKNYQEFSVACSKVKYGDNNSTAQALIKVTIIDSFSNPPCLSFTCRVGGMNIRSVFALPILINKLIEPYECSRENFFSMWNQFTISKEDYIHRMDCILSNPLDGKKTLMEFLKKIGSLLVSLNFNVYPPEDRSNFHEIEAGGIINMSDFSVPILLQASFVPSYTSEFRLSIRTKLPDASKFVTLTLDLFALLKFYVNPY